MAAAITTGVVVAELEEDDELESTSSSTLAILTLGPLGDLQWFRKGVPDRFHGQTGKGSGDFSFFFAPDRHDRFFFYFLLSFLTLNFH